MDPGWLILFLFLIIECVFVTLLVLPMPSNAVRRAVTDLIASLWDHTGIQYAVIAILVLDAVYFYADIDALRHPLYDLGLLTHESTIPCEMRAAMMQRERNAYITGFGLFLFFVLRRLVDIQDKLHQARHVAKSITSTGGKKLD
eukprot:CAMPEP_0113525218 /NCGR_PEP_ID=MMETSP0015_2-20120614/32_1 /TAXON_ID=2838 /ORGANISM="Odontella" /LENGTH=143 /DNA_ID=CAMNT_0000423345 /DNA_START=97 /DNA_END=528 /DNA_ORIENTATION=+ /assembly_acc=CAM_ASM_000160